MQPVGYTGMMLGAREHEANYLLALTDSFHSQTLSLHSLHKDVSEGTLCIRRATFRSHWIFPLGVLCHPLKMCTLNFHQILIRHLNSRKTSHSFSTGHNAAISVTSLDCALHCMYHPNKRGCFFLLYAWPRKNTRPQNLTYLSQSSTAKDLLLQFLLLFSSFISTWLKTSAGVMRAHQGTATVPLFAALEAPFSAKVADSWWIVHKIWTAFGF